MKVLRITEAIEAVREISRRQIVVREGRIRDHKAAEQILCVYHRRERGVCAGPNQVERGETVEP